jgi:hypothetical protein
MPELSTAPCFRRRVILDATDGRVVAAVEDDFHHFLVTLEHDGNHVTHVTAASPRSPWSICLDARAKLTEFVGMALSLTPAIDPTVLDYHFHCTHQYDLTGFAIAHAVRGGRRQYDIEVPDAHVREKVARLFRDGELYWEWHMNGSVFAAPEKFAGLNLRSIGDWATDHLDPDELEALKVLRRGFMVSGGRVTDLNQFDDNGVGFEKMRGACYAFQPVHAGKAKRNKGTQIDFSAAPNALLRECEPQLLQVR